MVLLPPSRAAEGVLLLREGAAVDGVSVPAELGVETALVLPAWLAAPADDPCVMAPWPMEEWSIDCCWANAVPTRPAAPMQAARMVT
jgi:hypothetical protein